MKCLYLFVYSSLVVLAVGRKEQEFADWKDVDNGHLVTGTGDSSRRRRAAEDVFISKCDQMAMTSRVITGITLRAGLADQSIPGDEAIAEMLKIGSVRMDDIEKFDKSKVDAFFSKIQSLKATGSTDVTNFEETVMLLEEWRQDFAALGNLDDTSVMDEYFGKVAQFNSSGFDSKSIGKMVSNISRTVTLLERISTLPDDIMSNRADVHYSHMLDLKTELEVLIPLVPKLNEMLQKLEAVDGLADEAVVRSQQFRFVQLVEDSFLRKQDVHSPIPATEKELTDMITTTAVLSPALDGAKTDLLMLSAIDSAMNPREITDRKHTAGFVNGFSDLQTLSSDVQNQWLKSTINGFDPDVIGSGLAPLRLLYDKSKEVADKWKPMEQVHETIERAAKVIEIFGDVSSVAVTADISEIANCALLPALRPITVLNVSEVVSNAIQFQKKVSLTMFLLNKLNPQSSLKNLDLLSKLNESINLTNNFIEDAKNLPSVIVKVKAFTGTQDLIHFLNEAFPSLTALQKAADSLNTLASKIASKSNEVKTFLDGAPASQLTDFFLCSSNIQTKMTSVVKAISVLRRIRSLQANTSFVADIRTATTAISDSIPLIGQLRSTASLRPDTHLQDLGSLRGSSKPFGDAVTALWMIRKVLEKNSSVNLLVDKADVVDSEIAMLSDKKVRKSIEKTWGGSKALKKSLEMIGSSLKVVMAAVRRRRQSTSGLTPFAKLFESVSGLRDLDLHVEQKLKALDELIAANPASLNQVGPVRNALEEVGALDLQFSRFSSTLSTIAQTLDDISLAFASSIPKSTTTPAGVAVPNHLPSQATPGSAPIVANQPPISPPVSTSTQKEVRDEKTSNGWLLYVCTVIIASVLVLIAYIIYIVMERQKLKKRKAEEKKFIDNERERLLASTGMVPRDTTKDRVAAKEEEVANLRKELSASKKKARSLKNKSTKEQKDSKKKVEDEQKDSKKKVEDEQNDSKNAGADKQRMEKENEDLKRENAQLDEQLKDARKKEGMLIRSIKYAKKKFSQIASAFNKDEEVKKNEVKLTHATQDLKSERKILKEREKSKKAVQANVFKERKEKRELEKKLDRIKPKVFLRETPYRIKTISPLVVHAIFDALKFKRDEIGLLFLPDDGYSLALMFFNSMRFNADRKLNHRILDSREDEARRAAWERSKLEGKKLKVNGFAQRYDASMVTFDLAGKAIAAASPSEDNSRQFWELIWQQNVFQLIKLEACFEYFAREIGSSLEFGRLIVLTSALEVHPDGEAVSWTLELKNTEEKAEYRRCRTITVTEVLNWRVNEPMPEATQIAVKRVYLATRRLKQEEPILVHCEDGVKRSATFIGIEFLSQVVYIYNDKTDVCDALSKLMDVREKAIETGFDAMFVQNMMLQCLIEVDSEITPEDNQILWNGMREQWEYYTRSTDRDYNTRQIDLLRESEMRKKEAWQKKIEERLEPTQEDED